jgi:hypothetical protein
MQTLLTAFQPHEICGGTDAIPSPAAAPDCCRVRRLQRTLYASDYYGPAYAAGYGYNDGSYGRPSYYGGENCGTPEELWRAAAAASSPPYYPGDR